jgi:glycosyltransferase involved in cell wall biosynthesis
MAHGATTPGAATEGRCPVRTRYGFVSTYPPTLCGLATFTAALYHELAGTGDAEGRVVRAVESPQLRSGPEAVPEVVGHLIAGDARTASHAATLLNDCDVAIVQHEYGVFGGPDGAEILRVLEDLTVASIVVLHTVLTAPTANQKLVLERLAARADAVITMTATARDRLATGYAVDMGKVNVIPHGAHVVHGSHPPKLRNSRPTVLTWGLIGPGKGIEWGIEAMASLTDLQPAPRYVVAGQTHPKVIALEGEASRDRRQRRVSELRLDTAVTFDSNYQHAAALAKLVRSADVVLLPYDSTDQVTSGVLIEAIAAHKPVIATRFPHAVELLGTGAGMLVPHQDPDAIATALRTLLTRRDVAASMTTAAGVSSAEAQWPAVAARYRDLAAHLIRARVPA